jgi:hypothetical protein
LCHGVSDLSLHSNNSHLIPSLSNTPFPRAYTTRPPHQPHSNSIKKQKKRDKKSIKKRLTPRIILLGQGLDGALVGLLEVLALELRAARREAGIVHGLLQAVTLPAKDVVAVLAEAGTVFLLLSIFAFSNNTMRIKQQEKRTWSCGVNGGQGKGGELHTYHHCSAQTAATRQSASRCGC